MLIHCNIGNNDYQQNSRFLHIFDPNKLFCNLLKTKPTNSIHLKTLLYIEVSFTDQNSQPIVIEERINH